MGLTADQINAMVIVARNAGLTPVEAAALRETLIMRALQPELADKLGMAIERLPAAQTRSMASFVEQSRALHHDIMTRGAADLNAMTDEDWEELINAKA